MNNYKADLENKINGSVISHKLKNNDYKKTFYEYYRNTAKEQGLIKEEQIKNYTDSKLKDIHEKVKKIPADQQIISILNYEKENQIISCFTVSYLSESEIKQFNFEALNTSDIIKHNKDKIIVKIDRDDLDITFEPFIKNNKLEFKYNSDSEKKLSIEEIKSFYNRINSNEYEQEKHIFKLINDFISTENQNISIVLDNTKLLATEIINNENFSFISERYITDGLKENSTSLIKIPNPIKTKIKSQPENTRVTFFKENLLKKLSSNIKEQIKNSNGKELDKLKELYIKLNNNKFGEVVEKAKKKLVLVKKNERTKKHEMNNNLSR